MLTPNPRESQPQFAIRFHAAMADEIPGTGKRNQACLKAWRNSANHQPLAKAVDARFPVSQYRRVRDVNCFEEHDVPASELPDGTKVEPKKYSRAELAEMVEGMNRRISDHDHFAPLTKGHTQIGPDGALLNDPDVLGYTGPYYLGQVGDVEPRWAIFEDEHHRLDSTVELDRRRGRSPEVWPYKNARDRFFHPVAALGAEMPRLNLLPARYTRFGNSGERVVVEFYGAGTTPYGGNASAPAFGSPRDNDMAPEQYGSDPAAQPAPMAQPAPDAAPAAGGAPDAGGGEAMGGSGDVPAIVDEIMQGLMETPPFQFLMELYSKSQGAGATPPAAAAPAPAAAAPPAAAPAPAPAAPPIPGQPPQQYSRRIAELEDQVEAERTARRAEETKRVRLERYSRLTQLAERHDLTPDVELERTADYSDEQFETHCGIIAEHYRRNPNSIPDFASMSTGNAKPAATSGPKKTAADLGKAEAEAIGKLAMSEGLAYGQARELYMRKRSEVAS